MAHDKAKDEAFSHVENIEKGWTSPVSSSTDVSDDNLAARIRQRIDWRLIPALGAMYGTYYVQATLNFTLQGPPQDCFEHLFTLGMFARCRDGNDFTSKLLQDTDRSTISDL